MLLLVLMLTNSGHAAVNYYSGEKMVALCDPTSEGVQRIADLNTCRGFLASVTDTYATLETWQGLDPYLCITEGTTVARLREVFLAYMKVHVEDWQKTASSLALNAFNEQWPCAD